MSNESDRDEKREERNEERFDGVPASGGIAIGPVARLAQEGASLIDASDRDPTVAIERFRAALTEADRLLGEIEALAHREVQESSYIFEAMRMMLADPVLAEGIEKRILEDNLTPREAIVAEMESLADHFRGSDDETMRTRVEDIHALQSHLLDSLGKSPLVRNVEHDSLLMLTSLLPSDVLFFARQGVQGFAIESGGINSHSAILARSLRIPMVAGLLGIVDRITAGDMAIIDGYTGRVIVNPTEATCKEYEQRKEKLEEDRRRLGALRDRPAETTDGVRICLGANLDMIDEIEYAVENGADEIGLMRTEYLVADHGSDLTMEEQLDWYCSIAERAYPLPVTLRAFDIGSEKLSGEKWERSSPLGLRGARLLLERPTILRRQIEAALRASRTKNLKLMLPMVTSVDEVRAFKALVREISLSLHDAGVTFDEGLPIGAMIETPASALVADALAREVDFLSIGSNDLVQYTLAVDRNDESLAAYYDELHPAILRLLRSVALAARRHRTPLTLCGELAAHADATALLIGLGIDHLSVSPSQLAPLKHRIRSISTHTAESIARRALRAATGDEVRLIINNY